MTASRIVGTALAVALLSTALAGCSGSPSSPSASTGTAVATTTAIPTPTQTPTPTPTPPGGAAAACQDEQLTGTYTARPQDSGAGQFYGDLTFTNVSAAACSFDGFPGLVAQDADGVQLGAAADGEGPESAVTIEPKGVAVARLHGTQPGAFSCTEAQSTTLLARFTADGAGPGVPVPAAIPVCADDTRTLSVGSLVLAG
ncbi:DUF4232 domain-containing protein [Leifsonia sp. Leaf264]|uniref:DUF4232 domain-containing protein n=1 Tax=Leifsonia sp. Leaf264 TaxID=1736314 RepID=UPI0006F40836|nr:DUF4232 domain-containing protein [Leifsonia sp. Leaf264]KQO95864.1 hypothetical protein ASF30_20000 [Leifsonia sp. Leaf264]